MKLEIGITKNLTTPLDNFDFSNPPIDTRELAKILCSEMEKNGGIGLSANQLGLPYRCFVMKNYPGSPHYVCFNPTIVFKSDETATIKEGCLSFPGIVVKITRPYKIRARFRDVNGEVQTEAFEGGHARVFQHEMMHMDGKIFWEDASWFHRSKAIKDWNNAKRKVNKEIIK